MSLTSIQSELVQGALPDPTKLPEVFSADSVGGESGPGTLSYQLLFALGAPDAATTEGKDDKVRTAQYPAV